MAINSPHVLHVEEIFRLAGVVEGNKFQINAHFIACEFLLNFHPLIRIPPIPERKIKFKYSCGFIRFPFIAHPPQLLWHLLRILCLSSCWQSKFQKQNTTEFFVVRGLFSLTSPKIILDNKLNAFH